jgi:hypothetical protein
MTNDTSPQNSAVAERPLLRWPSWPIGRPGARAGVRTASPPDVEARHELSLIWEAAGRPEHRSPRDYVVAFGGDHAGGLRVVDGRLLADDETAAHYRHVLSGPRGRSASEN